MSGRPKIANGRIGDVAPFRCGTAPGLCVSTCMLVVGGRHRGRTLCIWHPLGVGGLQPLRSAIGAAQSYQEVTGSDFSDGFMDGDRPHGICRR